MRNSQPPVEQVKGEGANEYLETSHPAFGTIRASRVSGAGSLFGSDFVHQSFVRISIHEAVLHRRLSYDSTYSKSAAFVAVDLSEAQWATLLATMNVGEGTPCTIARREYELVPRLPAPKSRTDQFAGEAAACMADAVKALEEARELVLQSGLSKVKQKELLDKLTFATSDITSNQKFVADQFVEHMDKTVEDAKIEVSGYLSGVLTAAGIESAADRIKSPMLALTPANQNTIEATE